MTWLKKLWTLTRDACQRWFEHNTFQLGAALAYYTVFSLAPIVLIAVGIGSIVFGAEAARRQVSMELRELAGKQMAQAFQQTIAMVHNGHGTGILATVIALVVMLIGATSVFAQLQEALNFVWGVKPRPGRGLFGMLRDRFLSFALVLCIGFLLLVSLIVGAAGGPGPVAGARAGVPALALAAAQRADLLRADHPAVRDDLPDPS